jgi:hypothetical protein
MTLAEFWKLIELLDREALARGDEDTSVTALTAALEGRDVAELESFSEHLAQVLFDIDGKVYADNAGASGQSDDGFLYSRCFVVAQGEAHYNRVKASPNAMSPSANDWCESLLYVAKNAWASRTGNDPSDWSFETVVSYESGSNEQLWPGGV